MVEEKTPTLANSTLPDLSMLPEEPVEMGIKDVVVEEEPVKRTRRRGVKIEIGGVKKEVLDQTEEEVKEYWKYRTPEAREALFQLAMDKETSQTVKVKALELLFKVTGGIVDKHEVSVINPEDVAKRGLEAARELESFKKQIEGGTVEGKDGLC